MDKSRANILQIQKYLNGELDAKAMHQLEREAQDDPFLMDALEGYQGGAGNQQANLDILTGQLSNRVNKRERRIIPWTTISIAAGVVGFMIVVGLLYKGNDTPVKQMQTAQVNELPSAKADTVANTPIITEPKANSVAASQPPRKTVASSGLHSRFKPVVADKNMEEEPAALAEVVMAPTPAANAESTPLDEMIMGTIAKQKDSVEMPLTVAVTKKAASQPLVSKAEGVQIIKDKRTDNAYELSKLNLPPNFSTGTVINNQGAFMPGATIKIGGKPVSFGQTDANGRFTLPAAAAKETVEVSYSGFNGRTNAVLFNANMNTANDASGLGYSNSAGSTSNLAHPQKGWVMYQLYLAQKSYLPAGEKPGIVELKFTVSPTGSISNITVVKGLSPAANKKAVSLIADGPKWVGNTNGKPEEKTLQLEFIIK
ncbi:carboxypeptidase regulatory-like domain-containing protein [Mucilaginibacter sp. ZT4R22]|uniref:Carboxypeptidase regulatory-like domain-containing protein n=1 Tax=Mucilaginibacter pankratovii TaxID=2772110 RepID=A0ABR7WVT9_9SPHI|nr:carboxypeptidase regulatory-like domain-containing protein [Mucilaginibacter pankratovii]MBD1365539.1 carboxypeptidase regulatory-like domain-containing protein [Mucilaginibacter pankratovii]